MPVESSPPFQGSSCVPPERSFDATPWCSLATTFREALVIFPGEIEDLKGVQDGSKGGPNRVQRGSKGGPKGVQTDDSFELAIVLILLRLSHSSMTHTCSICSVMRSLPISSPLAPDETPHCMQAVFQSCSETVRLQHLPLRNLQPRRPANILEELRARVPRVE